MSNEPAGCDRGAAGLGACGLVTAGLGGSGANGLPATLRLFRPGVLDRPRFDHRFRLDWLGLFGLRHGIRLAGSPGSPVPFAVGDLAGAD